MFQQLFYTQSPKYEEPGVSVHKHTVTLNRRIAKITKIRKNIVMQRYFAKCYRNFIFIEHSKFQFK